MGRFATDTGGGNFTPAPAGTHIARCFKIIDIGTQHDEYNGKPNVRPRVVFFWELPNELVETDEGQMPAVATKWYTNSLNEKANLRADLETWRGAFAEPELQAFDLASMIGQPCMLTIVAKSAEKTEVGGVAGLPKGMTCPAQVNPSYAFWIDNFQAEDLENLGGLKKWVEKSDEYKAMNGQSVKPANGRLAPAPAGPPPAQGDAERRLALQETFRAFCASTPNETTEARTAAWKAIVAAWFPGKTKEQVTTAQWRQLAVNRFRMPEPAPVLAEGEFKEDDIPF